MIYLVNGNKTGHLVDVDIDLAKKNDYTFIKDNVAYALYCVIVGKQRKLSHFGAVKGTRQEEAINLYMNLSKRF